MGKLTDVLCRQAKYSPGGKGNKLTDGGGLFLNLTSVGGKLWKLAYRFADKQKTLSLGAYPEVSLTAVRKAALAAREQLAQGIDPSMSKRIAKAAARHAAENTLEAVAREFHAKQQDQWSATHAEKWLRGLEIHIFPSLGRLPLPGITAPMVMDALRRVEAAGTVDMAHRLRQVVGRCSATASRLAAVIVIRHLTCGVH